MHPAITKQIYRKIAYQEQNPWGVKFFCIGLNKTGTTSLKKEFSRLHFKVGSQRRAEDLFDKYYFSGGFTDLIKYCRTAEFFQDLPFSCPETYVQLDSAFPKAKYILTVRDDAEQWYESITKFHSKLFGRNGRLPTIQDLEAATYRRKGFMKLIIKLFGTTDSDPYNKTQLIRYYEEHIRSVQTFFANHPERLMVINLSEPRAYERFQDFVRLVSPYDDFPWENKTSEIRERMTNGNPR